MSEKLPEKYNPFFNQVDSREPSPYNISIVGWEGDKCSVVVSMSGSFYGRLGEVWCRFGIADNSGPLGWYNHSGYLPCLVTSFVKDSVSVEIMHFCSKVTIDGIDYSLLYSRVKKTNNGADTVDLPASPSTDLLRLTPLPGPLSPGDTQFEDFVTAVDKFGNDDAPWPDDQSLLKAGSWDENFERMRSYWESRLEGIAHVEMLPDQQLVNAFKAGAIYQWIIMDGLKMDVGVNAYREEFSHDTIGMIATLIEIGDLELAKRVLNANRSRLVAPLDYPDGDYKYSWPWALYLLKTGDTGFIRSNFIVIRSIIRASASQITGPGGIMRLSCALDHPGHWLVDNWAMLTGLAAYKVIADRLGEKGESKWAVETYDKLLDACNKCIEELSTRENIDYLPAYMNAAYPESLLLEKKNTSAGWATAMHMGRWPWEGYKLGARQEGIMLDNIDSTYDFGFETSENVLPPHSFGGFSGWCSSYNAGYGFAALRGDRYRSEGIRAYQWMIENAMNGPFSWWETCREPEDDCAWQPGRHPKWGSGSCPHMWGDSFSRKILLNSLIDEFADGRIIIGRGIPEEWLKNGSAIKISNVPLQERRRFGYHLISNGGVIDIEFNGDVPIGSMLIDFPSDVPLAVTVDGKELKTPVSWPVEIPAGSRQITLNMRR